MSLMILFRPTSLRSARATGLQHFLRCRPLWSNRCNLLLVQFSIAPMPCSRRKTSDSMTASEQNPIKLRFHKLSERALAVVRPPDGAVPVERAYNADVHQGSCAQLISCGHPQKCPRLPRRSKKSVADCDNSISKTTDSGSTESGVDRCQPSPLRPQTA